MEINEKVKRFYENYWLHHKNNFDNEQSSKFVKQTFEKEAVDYAFDILKKHFGSLKGKKVLEIGPGEGQNILRFLRHGAKVTAIDVSKNCLRLCEEFLESRDSFKNVRLIEMDAHNLKFKDNQFDIVFIKVTLMHLNPVKVAKECRKVLKKNGVFLFIEPSKNNLLVNLYRNFSEYKSTAPRYLSYEKIISLSDNFSQSKIRGFYLFSFASIIFRRVPFLFKAISYILKKLEKILLYIFPILRKKCWLYVSFNVK